MTDATMARPVLAAIKWLRECHDWMLANDLDGGCPMQEDPLDIADALAALTPADHSGDVSEMIAAERERCAKIADDMRVKWGCPVGSAYDNGIWDQSIRIAGKIRGIADCPADLAKTPTPTPETSHG